MLKAIAVLLQFSCTRAAFHSLLAFRHHNGAGPKSALPRFRSCCRVPAWDTDSVARKGYFFGKSRSYLASLRICPLLSNASFTPCLTRALECSDGLPTWIMTELSSSRSNERQIIRFLCQMDCSYRNFLALGHINAKAFLREAPHTQVLRSLRLSYPPFFDVMVFDSLFLVLAGAILLLPTAAKPAFYGWSSTVGWCGTVSHLPDTKCLDSKSWIKDPNKEDVDSPQDGWMCCKVWVSAVVSGSFPSNVQADFTHCRILVVF